MERKNIQKGFTLVELLVVIAIIAVLAGAVLLAINPQAQLQKSRDSRRLADLDALQKAVSIALVEGEISLAATGSCTTCTSATGSQAVTGAGWVMYTPITGKTGLSKYIPTLPLDPTNANGFVYSFGSSLTDFEINAVLEYPGNGTKMSTDGGTSTTIYEVGTALNIL